MRFTKIIPHLIAIITLSVLVIFYADSTEVYTPLFVSSIILFSLLIIAKTSSTI